MAEEEVKLQKGVRSKLKSRVTGAAHKLAGAITRGDNKVDELYKTFENTYIEFLETHTYYCELVDSDETLPEGYAKVGGLTNEEYLSKVTELFKEYTAVYDDFVSSQNSKCTKLVCHDIDLILKQADHIQKEIEKVIDVGIAGGQATEVLIEEAAKHIASLKEQFSILCKFSEGNSLVGEIDTCILGLSSLIVSAKQGSSEGTQNALLGRSQQTGIRTTTVLASNPPQHDTPPSHNPSSSAVSSPLHLQTMPLIPGFHEHAARDSTSISPLMHAQRAASPASSTTRVSGSIVDVYSTNKVAPPRVSSAVGDDTGADDTGADDTGADDTGADDTGADDTGADDTGADDTGAADIGADNTGADDTGADDTGADDIGADDTGADDTGADDTGADDTGADDTGADDTGADDTGADDTIGDLLPMHVRKDWLRIYDPGGWSSSANYKGSLELVDKITEIFWKQWTALYAPTLLAQRKWTKEVGNLKPGDVVVVMDSNELRNRYYIARVGKVFSGGDGKVRRVSIAYKNFRAGEKVYNYKGAKDTVVTRSVHKLALLAPVVTRAGEQ